MVACPLCRFSCPQCRFFGVLRADEKLTEHTVHNLLFCHSLTWTDTDCSTRALTRGDFPP
jgi:hypothetical protein